MEDILDVYDKKAEEKTARLCFNERPCQLIGDTIAPLPVKPGQVAKEDSKHVIKFSCVVLFAYDLDTGQRYAEVREQKDYAEFMDQLIRTYYSDKEKVILVQDNLNTHPKGSFYEHLPIERAGQLNEQIEFHFTPKHASWLNMTEIEFSALSRQCLDRRIDSIEKIRTEVQAWQQERNKQQVKIHWTHTQKMTSKI